MVKRLDTQHVAATASSLCTQPETSVCALSSSCFIARSLCRRIQSYSAFQLRTSFVPCLDIHSVFHIAHIHYTYTPARQQFLVLQATTFNLLWALCIPD